MHVLVVTTLNMLLVFSSCMDCYFIRTCSIIRALSMRTAFALLGTVSACLLMPIRLESSWWYQALQAC